MNESDPNFGHRKVSHKHCDSVDYSSRTSTSDESDLSLGWANNLSCNSHLTTPGIVQKRSLRQIDLDEVTRHSQQYKTRLSCSSQALLPARNKYSANSGFQEFPGFYASDDAISIEIPRAFKRNEVNGSTNGSCDLQEILKDNTPTVSRDTPDSLTIPDGSLVTCETYPSDYSLPDSSQKLLQRFSSEKKNKKHKFLAKFRQKF